MANVEHSVLTGSDLHESKGVAAAAANKVFVTNGAGSGSFTTVPASAITAAGVLVFQAQLYHIRASFSNGTDGGSLSTGTWNTREINTEMTDDLTITTAGNQMSLAAGTYWLEAEATTNFTGNFQRGTTEIATSKLRLRNITDTATLLTGMSGRLAVIDDGGGNDESADFSIHTTMCGRFTLGGTKSVEIQNYTTNNLSSPGIKGGKAVSSGENEVYLDLKLWKIS